MTKVFLSYRRADSAGITGRIDDRLVGDFGRTNVFKDIDSIPYGVDFREHLSRAVGQCDALMVVIGDDWCGLKDEKGNRRLDDPGDFVRIEVESALERDIPVIPVLLGNTQMPDEDGLPPSMRALAFRNAARVRPDPDFHSDMDRIIQSIAPEAGKQKPAGSTGRSKLPIAASVVVLAILAILAAWGAKQWLPPGPAEQDPSEVDKREIASTTDSSITNSIGMSLALIPAGEFNMGRRESLDSLVEQFPGEWPGNRFDNELHPPQPVKIAKPFYMGVHEVTIGQFRQFVEDESYQTEVEEGEQTVNTTGVTRRDGDWQHTGHRGVTDNHPVTYVTWNDAQRFCKWLSKKEKCKVRLPTEQEWEYACRAGTETRYWTGDDPESLVDSANVPNCPPILSLQVGLDRTPTSNSWILRMPRDISAIQFTDAIPPALTDDQWEAWRAYDNPGHVFQPIQTLPVGGFDIDAIHYRLQQADTGTPATTIEIENSTSLTLYFQDAGRGDTAELVLRPGETRRVKPKVTDKPTTVCVQLQFGKNNSRFSFFALPGSSVSIYPDQFESGDWSRGWDQPGNEIQFINKTSDANILVYGQSERATALPPQLMVEIKGVDTGPTDFIQGDDAYAALAPVGKGDPNPFGLYDMHGNVWEWCQNQYSGPRPPDADRSAALYAKRGACYI